uniref:Putative secreted protein n=1 Tax=Amblyomma cajennense TaxID=34607 RepID=A0A023FBJ7_AMBCJ
MCLSHVSPLAWCFPWRPLLQSVLFSFPHSSCEELHWQGVRGKCSSFPSRCTFFLCYLSPSPPTCCFVCSQDCAWGVRMSSLWVTQQLSIAVLVM